MKNNNPNTKNEILELIDAHIVHYVQNYGGSIYYDVKKKEYKLNTDLKEYLASKLQEVERASVMDSKVALIKVLQAKAFDPRVIEVIKDKFLKELAQLKGETK